MPKSTEKLAFLTESPSDADSLPEMPYTRVDMTRTFCLMDTRTWCAEYRNNTLQCAGALRHPWLAAAGRPARYTVT